MTTLAFNASLTDLGASAPDWVMLSPRGAFTGRDGRRFMVGDGVADSISLLGMDLPIDLEHAIDLAPPGQPRPAQGWVVALEARDDGIYGRVRWTDAGRQAIESGQYRYLSPALLHEKADGRAPLRVVGIARAALTNNPNLPMPALNSQTDEVSPMNTLLAALASVLGLPDDATEEAALAALNSLRAPDPAQFVPIAAHKALQDQVTALVTLQAQESATRAVDNAISAGRLSPAQRAWALALCAKDPASFEAFVGSAPPIVTQGQIAPGAADAGRALSAEEIAVCAQLGLEHDVYTPL